MRRVLIIGFESKKKPMRKISAESLIFTLKKELLYRKLLSVISLFYFKVRLMLVISIELFSVSAIRIELFKLFLLATNSAHLAVFISDFCST